jgi:hypothetical protein
LQLVGDTRYFLRVGKSSLLGFIVIAGGDVRIVKSRAKAMTSPRQWSLSYGRAKDDVPPEISVLIFFQAVYEFPDRAVSEADFATLAARMAVIRRNTFHRSQVPNMGILSEEQSKESLNDAHRVHLVMRRRADVTVNRLIKLFAHGRV